MFKSTEEIRTSALNYINNNNLTTSLAITSEAVDLAQLARESSGVTSDEWAWRAYVFYEEALYQARVHSGNEDEVVLAERAMNYFEENHGEQLERIRQQGGVGGPSSKDNNKSKGGCYIATAVYGSYEAPQVRVLRRFRDTRLSQSATGRAFIALYYRLSPFWATHLNTTSTLSCFVRKVLDKFVSHLENEQITD